MTPAMADVLLTKLRRPPLRPGLTPRARLAARLAAGLDQPLTLVCAPAGFGKTTLVSTWLATLTGAAAPHLAWLALEPDDNDPARFLLYLVQALAHARPGFGAAALALLQSPPPPVPAALHALLNELTQSPARFVLALDDYHVIHAPAVHALMATLLEHLPPTLRLTLITRADPPLPLPRLRARRQLVELRSADLRFTETEAADFLHQTLGLEIAPAEITALSARTEGWIAGLQLAALSMQGRADVAGFVTAFAGSHRYIFDYLAEEVFQRQPPYRQAFLKHTAILDRLSAPVCEALLGPPAPGAPAWAALLRQVEAANLFLTALDDERRWYRYHPLFAEYLQTFLAPEEARRLHLRAGAWFAAQADFAEAVRHALAAGAPEDAAQWVEAAAGPMLTRGEWGTLLAWFARLPEPVIQARPALALFHAWGLALTGQAAAAEARLASVTGVNTPEWHSQAAAIRGQNATLRGDLPNAIAYGRQALALLPPEATVLRGVVAMNLGSIYTAAGQLAEAEHTLIEARAATQKAGNSASGVSAGGLLAQVYLELDRPAEAERLLRELLAAPPGPPGPLAASLHALLGEVVFSRGDPAAAEAELRQALALARQFQLAETEVICAAWLALTLAARGQAPAADAVLEAARAIVVTVPGVTAHLEAAAALLAARRGDADACAHWARTHAPRPLSLTAPQRQLEFTAQLEVWRAEGRMAEAQALAEALARQAEAAGWRRCARLFAAYATPPAAGLVEPLSARELEVLRQLAAGASNRAIAAALVISLGTVKKHLNNIFGKLGVASRTQAAARARELGLL